MNGAPPPVDFGQELKDSFKPVNAWVTNGIAWLDDIQTFYRERAAIEKDYATKLNALSKRFYDKKSKKSAVLSVGENPALTPGSLESASLTTWTTILNNAEEISKEHDALSTQLTSEVCDVLKSLETRYDEFRKKHESVAAKLASERDSVYNDLKKCKSKYDTACQEVEQKRQKVDKSHDGTKAKAEKAYRAEMAEMNNVKNTYLLQLNVANHYKRKYYHEDLPAIVNSLQDLNETRVAKLNLLWTASSNFEKKCHENCIRHLEMQISEIQRNVPSLDSGMFAKHNATAWQEPGDFLFEPSPIWHDTPNMVTDEPATIFLRNILSKSRRGLEGAKEDVSTRNSNLETLRRHRDAAKLDESKAEDEISATRSLLHYHEELLPFATKLLTFQVETDTILSQVGDQERGAQSHNFKPTTFKIPTNCDLCGERAWGITAKGVVCRDCGYTAHAKCEMKIPATCPGVLDKAAKKALKEEKRQSVQTGSYNGSETDLSSPGLSRSNTMTSMSSSYAAAGGGSLAPTRIGSVLGKSPSPVNSTSTPPGIPEGSPPSPAPTRTIVAPPPTRRVLAPPPERFIKSPPPGESKKDSLPTGTMKYAFTPDEEDAHEQLTLKAGAKVTVLDDDDSGWLQVRSGGEEGQVPKEYVEIDPPAPASGPPPILTPRPTSTFAAAAIGKKGPAPPPPRGHRKGFSQQLDMVRALYDYDPHQGGREPGEDELEFSAHDEFVLLAKGDPPQWNRVRAQDGREGIVPEAYMEEFKKLA